MHRKKLIMMPIIAFLLCSCGESPSQTDNVSAMISSNDNTSNNVTESVHYEPPTENVPSSEPVAIDDSGNIIMTQENLQNTRTPVCLIPTVPGEKVLSNSVASIDYSNQHEGYIGVSYYGNNNKVKLQITKEQGTTYTYNLIPNKGYEFFPLSVGNGSYTIVVYENVYDNQYADALTLTFSATITNEFGPNLYPNQYVNFAEDNQTIQIAASITQNCSDDLQVVTEIYNYVSGHITYDYSKAETVQSGYLCNIDETLQKGTGICLDYASVMCSMLRSQQIPTRLEVGYAGTAYHAWISTYITDVGWVNGIIQFDGHSWQIMDPTFASTTDPGTLKDFIGDGKNYQTKYIY